MYYLYGITGLFLIISFFIDKKKTLKALKISIKKFIKVLPQFLNIIIIISILFIFLTDSVILKYLGKDNLFISFVTALVLGSITLMPGFIVFPLSGILVTKGISYMVLSGFTTTLMMVGIIYIPLEKSYFGIKVAIIRNIIFLIIAIIVGLITGLVYGEIL